MSDSDQTWSAAGDEPTAPATPPTPPNPWPQYAWPTDATPAEPPAQPAGTEAPSAPPSWVGTAPTAPSTPPPTIPPAGYGAGGWGMPPSGPAGGSTGGWQQPQHPSSTSPASRRILAVIAALALVLASAGVGAAIATALHRNSNSDNFALSPSTNNGSSNNPFGNGNNPFGNGSNPFGNGNNPFGNGSSNNNGSSNGSSGSGSLNQNAIASKVNPAIVNIDTTLANGRAAGTGMIIGSNGAVLTNNHVIADATSIKVTIGGSGTAHNAHVVGYDVADDVALVQVDGVSNLPTITFGEPSKLTVGDAVVAIGNALGKGGAPTVTQGHVTALNQDVTAGDQGGESETLHGMIQVDAPIQPGDSGGALVDPNGRVVGMNTAAAGGNFRIQSGSNIGFAIPIDHAVGIVRQIQSGSEGNGVHIGSRGLLGVNVQDLSNQNAFGLSQVAPVSSGALVVTPAQSNTGASAAGIQQGDVITRIDGVNIKDQNALRLALAKYHSGDSVKVTWVDTSGMTHTANVKLVDGPPA